MKMNRNSLVFVPLVVCFPVIANAIEDYTPFVRPTLEQATDDADWIAWFNYEQGHLSLKKELKGRLPEHWNADLALPSHYHPKQWAMVKHADFFVFGLNDSSSAKADTIRIALRGL